ncbi:cytochrome c oxidase subunit II [Bacillaceae bacterium]
MTGCSGQENLSTLIPKGEGADYQYFLIKLTLYLMLLVVVVVTVLFVYALVRYRAKKGDDSIPEQVEGSTTLEIIWTVIPVILIGVIAVPLVKSQFALADMPEEGLKIKVTAHQYWWEFEYPDYGIVTAQDMVMPVGEKVALELKSVDVIHSFWVPALGGKIDTNPENVNKIWLQAEETGVYKGKCAELCGPSHALMDFKVKVVTKEEFAAWVEKMKQPNPEPATAEAKEGQKIFSQSCMGCHAVEGDKKSPGPNLKGFADRETIAGYLEMNKEELLRWLKDPQSVKQANTMPAPAKDLKLSEEQLSSVAEYLMNLKLAE